MRSKTELENVLNQVANCMMTLKSDMKEKFPISLIDIDCWEWPQGVGLFGLHKYYEQTKNEEVLDFFINWFDNCIEKGVSEKNINTTAPMLTLTYIYEITKKQKYKDLIEEWTDWIMDSENGLIRTGDNCFQHMITGDANDSEILIDTLFMTGLFLERSGLLLKRQDCIDEANYQILNHIKYLFDKDMGLFYHGYNFKRKDNYGEVYWGRGNGWYTLGIMEYLQQADIDSAIRNYLLSVYKSQCETLIKFADKESGLWHTVIDDQESYIEISASAAFLCGIMQGVRIGVLEKEKYMIHIEKAVENIFNYIKEDGTVLNVSYGTPIGENKEFYKEIVCCPMTYGQALMIIFLQEAMMDFWH